MKDERVKKLEKVVKPSPRRQIVVRWKYGGGYRYTVDAGIEITEKEFQEIASKPGVVVIDAPKEFYNLDISDL